MVGVVGSSPIAPTKFGRRIKHLAVTLGAFFLPVRKKYGKAGVAAAPSAVLARTWLRATVVVNATASSTTVTSEGPCTPMATRGWCCRTLTLPRTTWRRRKPERSSAGQGEDAVDLPAKVSAWLRNRASRFFLAIDGGVRRGGLPCRPTLPRRSRRQGLRARGASACGLRPSSNPDGCAAPWCSGLGQSRPTQTGVRHVVVFHFFR